MDTTLVLYSQSEGTIYSYVPEVKHKIQSGEFLFLKSGILVQVENIISNETTQEKLATCRLVLAGISGEHDGKKIVLPFGYLPPEFSDNNLSSWVQNAVDKEWDWIIAMIQSLQIEDIQE